MFTAKRLSGTAHVTTRLCWRAESQSHQVKALDLNSPVTTDTCMVYQRCHSLKMYNFCRGKSDEAVLTDRRPLRRRDASSHHHRPLAPSQLSPHLRAEIPFRMCGQLNYRSPPLRS